MVAALALAVGLMSFEQLSISYLMPFMQPVLALSNGQVGWVTSIYWLAFAASSCTAGALTHLIGGHKRILVALLVLLSTCAGLSGAISSLWALVFARAVMGLWEGALLTTAQAAVALRSTADSRATNLGIVGGVVPNLLGILIAPLVVVQVALRFGWRAGFLVVVLPALICAVLISRLVSDVSADGPGSSTVMPAAWRDDIRRILRFRGIWLSTALCAFFVAYLTLGFTFLPLEFVGARHFRSQEMSILMGVLGVSSVVYAYAIPALSNRVGRRLAIVSAAVVGVLCPMAALYYAGPLAALALLLFLGWALSGIGSLSMGTIPSETVPAPLVSTAIGWVVSVGVLFGGFAAPAIAGWSADHWGLSGALYVQSCCAAGAALAAAALRTKTSQRRPATAGGQYFVGQKDVRPWGSWSVIETRRGYIVKLIDVKPGQLLSLQRHRFRTECWVVIRGTGSAVIDDRAITLSAGDVACIDPMKKHRIGASADDSLLFVEIQMGDILEESDIERFDDRYGRAKGAPG